MYWRCTCCKIYIYYIYIHTLISLQKLFSSSIFQWAFMPTIPDPNRHEYEKNLPKQRKKEGKKKKESKEHKNNSYVILKVKCQFYFPSIRHMSSQIQFTAGLSHSTTSLISVALEHDVYSAAWTSRPLPATARGPAARCQPSERPQVIITLLVWVHKKSSHCSTSALQWISVFISLPLCPQLIFQHVWSSGPTCRNILQCHHKVKMTHSELWRLTASDQASN